MNKDNFQLKARGITDIIHEDIRNLKIKCLKPIELRLPLDMQKNVLHELGKMSKIYKKNLTNAPLGTIGYLFGIPVTTSDHYEIVVRGRW